MAIRLESLTRFTLSPYGGKEPSTFYVNNSPITLPPSNRPSTKSKTLLATFLDSYKEGQSYRKGNSVVVDGYNLSIAAVAAVARHLNTSVVIDESPSAKDRLRKSRAVITSKMEAGKSVYGVSTGYGGSADTRTDDPLNLGNALLQHQHAGVISTRTTGDVLSVLDPLTSTTMPESWVRGAILIRMNSLIRGHSGVRFELIEQMAKLLLSQITPLVPLRGSISASGDLSPLSYIAGTLIGNPSIRTICRSPSSKVRRIVPSNHALAEYNIKPLSLQSKEHLGILNGTAFSASVAALALNDAAHLALLAQILTAMGVESLLGTQASFASFIHAECRPHPGQVEAAKTIFNLLEGSIFATSGHEEEVSIEEDKGQLRQDRYPLRTSPQFLGPQIEDILSALETVTLECNSTTDNPLIDGNTGTVHHGGNFQAMAVTNAMEKTRLALHHIGKLLFAQATELINPAMNRGLPPNLAATDPSLDYHAKGIDIGMAAYVSELGYLANPVSTHVQSAEIHNQAVNSLALISGRATLNALDTLTILMSSYVYAVCQALDLRALQSEFETGLSEILRSELDSHFGRSFAEQLYRKCYSTVLTSLEHTSSMDCVDRMNTLAESCMAPLVNHFLSSSTSSGSHTSTIEAIPAFKKSLSTRCVALYTSLRREYLLGERGSAPAAKHLSKTRGVYEYVRTVLGVKMHGTENLDKFTHVGIDGLVGMPGGDDGTVGENVTRIYEAIRDGRFQSVVVNTLS